MMGCVTTPSFSVLINGKPFGNIHSTRGIRQGDHLSPYLFLLCAEGFTSLLAKAKVEGHIKGVSICRSAPKISNLMFANDSLLFCRATNSDVAVINEVRILMPMHLANVLIWKSLQSFSIAITLPIKKWGLCQS